MKNSVNTLEKTVPATGVTEGNGVSAGYGVTVHTDKNGVTREYREVKRKAAVGELVKATSMSSLRRRTAKYKVGDVGTVATDTPTGCVAVSFPTDGEQRYLKHDEDSGGNPYVVLEPTDIIHHDGKRYREVKREANVGELVKIDYTPEDYPYFKSGEVCTVLRTTDWYIDVKFSNSREGDTEWSVGPAASNSTYVVLEPVGDAEQKPATTDSNARITQLEAEIEATKHRVAVLERKLQVRDTATAVAERNDGALQKMADVIGDLYKPSVPVKQRSYTRAEIVELAKKDVEELKEQMVGEMTGGEWPLAVMNRRGHLAVNFIVNRKKRTVVALVELAYFPGEIREKGISHCAPDDCFNVHIGKAIALRRALGLDVPDYYVNAPKPTEAQVGDVVHLLHIDFKQSVDDDWEREEVTRQMGSEDAVLVDDSHDFGGELS